jgi:hypothetical protein
VCVCVCVCVCVAVCVCGICSDLCWVVHCTLYCAGGLVLHVVITGN